MFAYDPLTVIETAAKQVGAAAAGDLSAPVPGCPGWTLRDLVGHLGGVQRFWAAAVTLGGARPDRGPRPAGDLAGWYAESAQVLLAALREHPSDAPCWTWWGEPATVGAVTRHQVQEAMVHGWDAQSVAGTPRSLDPAAAADGVDEFLSVMLGGRTATLSAGVRLVAGEAAWAVGPEPVAATISGPASDLVLLLYRRLPLAAVTVDGDMAAARALVAAADTE